MWQIAQQVVEELERYPQIKTYTLSKKRISALSPEYAVLPLKDIKFVFTEKLPDNVYGELSVIDNKRYRQISINVNAFRKRGSQKTTYNVHHELTHYLQTLKSKKTPLHATGTSTQIKNANLISYLFSQTEIDARLSEFSRYLDHHRGEFKRLSEIPFEEDDQLLRLKVMTDGINLIKKETDKWAGSIYSTITILYRLLFPNSKTRVNQDNFEPMKQKILSILTKKYDYIVKKANKVLYDHMQ